MEASGIGADLDELREPVMARLRSLAEHEVIRRIWDRDHTVWPSDPAEIADRLGWLEAIERSRDRLPQIRAVAESARADGLTRTLLLGMGGSSLAPEVIRRTFPGSPFDLQVLDTTHPDAVARAEAALDRTLILVASKSGTTIETRSHMARFLEVTADPSRFVAITDPGTPLAEEARRLGFRTVIEAPPDVGGRFSALTVFGLMPAALCGVDPELLLVEAARMAGRCVPDVPAEANPAAALGAIMAEAALAGRDKLTLRASGHAAPLGPWLEQLIAESTGKEGTGILPVDAEPAAGPYGDDRLFLGIGEEPEDGPWASVPFARPAELGGLFFLFELATAVAGHVLGIQPFDQPDVQAAKDRTAEVLEAGGAPEEAEGDLGDLLELVKPGDYVAIQAFVDPTPEAWTALQAARARIGLATGAATTLGFGPRYLHSTGQLHKGGPPSGVFVQVVEPASADVPIPGRAFTFGDLMAAQAAGDLAALRDAGRRVARIPREALEAWTG